MKRVKITGMPMQYGGTNPYIPFVGAPPAAPVTPEERTRWNQVAGQMRQQPGTYVRNWDHNQDFQNQFMQSQGFDPGRVSAIQADMIQRNQSMPGTVKYGSQGMSGADNWYGSKTKDQRYVNYSYEHLDSHGNRYPGTAGFTARGTEPMSQEEMSGWNNSAYSQPHQWKTNNQGVPMNASQSEVEKLYPSANGKPTAAAFPTRDEAIAKWKARGKTTIGQDNGPAPDYSIDAVRAGYAEYGGSYATGGATRKVRITSMPTHMQMGGGTSDVPGGQGKYASQQSGHGYALDRFWSSPAGYPGSTSKVNPYGKIGNTLPEAEDGGDINAEKQERVLGDFDQDGSLELMNVNGPSHAEGGKDVNIPANSFVFSDTKDLKVKDASVLAMFGLQPKRGGYTPAEIAKKYDLNKFKGTLDNPNADEYASSTAKLMTDSYLAKLNKLALIQEQMKGHMGMPNSATNAPAKYGGRRGFQVGGSTNILSDEENTANNAANGAVGQTVNPVYNMYPNVLTADGYAHERPTADNMQSFVQQSINPHASDYGKPMIPPDQYDAMRRAGWNGNEDPGKWAQREQPGAVQQAITKSGMKAKAADAVTGNDLGNAFYGPRWKNFNPQGPDWNPTMENITAMGNTIPTSNLPADNTNPIPTAANEQNGNTTIDKGTKTVPVGQDQYSGFRFNPNFYGNLFNVLQMAQVHKFKPWEPVPQAVIPDTVFMDPTRALAAIQEEANAGYQADAAGDQRAARANYAARQGVAGKQGADVIGQYANQNVAIANQANQQAAAITNDLYARQANRIAELNKAGFLADRDYQREMGRLQSEMVDRLQKEHDNRVKTAWMNKTSPFFNINPIDQMPDFKSGNAQAEFYKQVYGMGTGNGGGQSGDKEAAAAKYAQRLMELYPGLSMEMAAKYARQEHGLMARESEMYKPGAMVPTMRYTGLPVGAGQPNTYGMPQYEWGGETKTSKLKKFLRA